MLSLRTQLLIWILLLGFWITFSFGYHPTLLIDFCVTTILLAAYAGAIYLNVLLLMPWLWRTHRFMRYLGALILSMGMINFIALAGVRAVYFSLSDAERIGDYWEHYVIDLFGMVVHVAAASALLWILRRSTHSKRNISSITNRQSQ